MTRSSLSRAALPLAALLLASEASAETPAAPAAPATPPPAASVATGTIPQAPVAKAPAVPRAKAWRKRPKKVARANPDGPIATYPSFRVLEDGTSRVWLEVTRKVTVTENKAQGRAVYHLAGVSLAGHNSGLPLYTGFFRTPVDRVALVEQGDGADLVIETREAAAPTQRIIDSPRGIVLQVDFPKPAGTPDEPVVPAAPRKTRSASTQRLGETSNDSD